MLPNRDGGSDSVAESGQIILVLFLRIAVLLIMYLIITEVLLIIGVVAHHQYLEILFLMVIHPHLMAELFT